MVTAYHVSLSNGLMAKGNIFYFCKAARNIWVGLWPIEKIDIERGRWKPVVRIVRLRKD
jgi:hypothetical protein